MMRAKLQVVAALAALAAPVAVAAQAQTQPQTSTTVAAPTGRRYVQGTVQRADYSCTDGLSGIAQCGGTVADGAPIDTSTIGRHRFSATAVDRAGNGRTTTFTYTVVIPPIDYVRQPPAKVNPRALVEVINDCKVQTLFASPVILANLAKLGKDGVTAPSLHTVIGTWVLPVYLTMALTGLYFSFEWYKDGVTWLLARPHAAAAKMAAKPPRLGNSGPVPSIGFDPAWTTFQREEGDRFSRALLTLPGGPGTTIRIRSW